MYGVIDVGTTGVKLAVFDNNIRCIYYEKVELGYESVGQGRVEQNSIKLAEIVKGFAKKAKSLGARKIGLSTYRASVLAWSRTGKPLSNVITWIDGRGREVVEKLPTWVGMLKTLSKSLGKVISPDAPAILMKWLYNADPSLQDKVSKGDAYMWTLDSYLLFTLTGRFLSDVTSAALTGLVNPKDLSTIDIVYSLLSIPKASPEIVDCVYDFGEFEGIEISVSIADQQAASVYHGLLEAGRVSGVHGTGSFIEQSTRSLITSGKGLVPLLIASIDGRRFYGVEGFLRSSGLIVEWLKNMGFFRSYEEMEELASSGRMKSIFIPSFRGLRLPEASNLRGIITGLDPGVSKEDLLKGLAWGIALYLAFILDSISRVAGKPQEPLWSGGGYSRSNTFLQVLADATGMRVARTADTEASIRGVLNLLLYSDGRISMEELRRQPTAERIFEPNMKENERKALLESYASLLRVISRWEGNVLLSGKL
ncbi:MAG: FGGY family carbohydrate kinase [Candidatus Methanodesulfokora washburnensis]|jgi:glycerol kinase